MHELWSFIDGETRCIDVGGGMELSLRYTDAGPYDHADPSTLEKAIRLDNEIAPKVVRVPGMLNMLERVAACLDCNYTAASIEYELGTELRVLIALTNRKE